MGQGQGQGQGEEGKEGEGQGGGRRVEEIPHDVSKMTMTDRCQSQNQSDSAFSM